MENILSVSPYTTYFPDIILNPNHLSLGKIDMLFYVLLAIIFCIEVSSQNEEET